MRGVRFVLGLSCAFLVRESNAAEPLDVFHVRFSREGQILIATVLLEVREPGNLGFSFALCHDESDLHLTGSTFSEFMLTANRGGPPDLAGTFPSAAGGFTTCLVLLSLRDHLAFPVGRFEVLRIEYELEPGGTGQSIAFCALDTPPIGLPIVTRDGASVEAGFEVPDPRFFVRAAGPVDLVPGANAPNLASVPIVLSTPVAGAHGGELHICYNPSVVAFRGVEPGEAVAALTPTIDVLDNAPGRLRIGWAVAGALPAAQDLELLKLVFEDARAPFRSSPVAFCRPDGAESVVAESRSPDILRGRPL